MKKTTMRNASARPSVNLAKIKRLTKELTDQKEASVVLATSELDLRRALSFAEREAITQLAAAANENTTLQRLRAAAERSGKWEGESEPQYCGCDGRWIDAWHLAGIPIAARASAMAKDREQPATATVYAAEHPDLNVSQLGKLALIEAYHAAFPAAAIELEKG